MFNTPILFLIFNRPIITKIVFERLREIKPRYLYIAADGPREDHNNEFLICKQTRDIVLNGIDWDCQVKTLFREKNLGCGRAVSEAITWFFQNIEEGIIVEDDCLPSISFFNFCSNLLEKFRFNENIYIISGNNFQKKQRSSSSYYFSAYGHIWGWATWRRAWNKYNLSLKGISNERFKECLNLYFHTKREIEYWYERFITMKYNPIDTWDYQWLFILWMNGGINILPNLNLVKNIGFNEEATHTKGKTEKMLDMESFEIGKIMHPELIAINKKADLYTFDTILHYNPNILVKYKEKIKRAIRKGISLKKGRLMRTIINIPQINKCYFLRQKKWKDIEYFDEQWKERIYKMSKYLNSHDSIIDLGCGQMWLKDYISESNQYYPIDYKKRQEKCGIYDFNKGEFPPQIVDVAFVSGVLEYIENPKWFIAEISKHASKCIISYCSIDYFPNIMQRLSFGWVNNLTLLDIISLFEKQGMSLIDQQLSKQSNSIFFFQKQNENRLI
jgi:hypothetical protein